MTILCLPTLLNENQSSKKVICKAEDSTQKFVPFFFQQNLTSPGMPKKLMKKSGEKGLTVAAISGSQVRVLEYYLFVD